MSKLDRCKPRRKVPLLCLTPLLMASAVHAQSGSSSAEIQALREALAAQKATIAAQQEALNEQTEVMAQQAAQLDTLMQRLDALEGTVDTAAGVVVTGDQGANSSTIVYSDAAPGIGPDPRMTEAIDDLLKSHANETSMEIYGFAMTDVIQDSGRVNPDWQDALRPSRIGTQPGEYGSDGQNSVSVKQSRFGVRGSVPTGGDKPALDYMFEFDLFGVGPDAGQTTMRLRHFYGEWGPILAGQTHSLFMDINVFPNTIDYWGPPGMVFLRNPQIRWTPLRSGGNSFAIAVENPNDDIDPGFIREISPELADNLQANEELPDVSARFKSEGDWGHFQAAGIYRRIGWETSGVPNSSPSGFENGWGINLSTNINVFARDRIIASVVHGEGIASYMNDGGTDLAPGGSLLEPTAELVPTTGFVLYYDRWWNDRWSSSFGYSQNRQDNTNLQEGNAMHKGDYASVNLLHYPAEHLMFGAELLYGKRTDNDGSTGDTVRLQLSAKYNFSLSPWPR